MNDTQMETPEPIGSRVTPRRSPSSAGDGWMTRTRRVLVLTEGLRLFATPDGEPGVVLSMRGVDVAVPLLAPHFEAWIKVEYYVRYCDLLDATVLGQVMPLLTLLARRSGVVAEYTLGVLDGELDAAFGLVPERLA